jgi:hypothetical protein
MQAKTLAVIDGHPMREQLGGGEGLRGHSTLPQSQPSSIELARIAALGRSRVIPRHVDDADAHKQRNKDRTPTAPSTAAPADRIERLQQHRSQQLLRRDRRPAHRTTTKIAGERSQSVVHDRANRPRRMILPNSSFKIYVAEQRPERSSSPRTIRSPHLSCQKQNHIGTPVNRDFFNSLLVLLCHKLYDTVKQCTDSDRRFITPSPQFSPKPTSVGRLKNPCLTAAVHPMGKASLVRSAKIGNKNTRI